MSSKLNSADNTVALGVHFHEERVMQEFLFDCEDLKFKTEVFDLDYCLMWGLGHLLPPAPCPPKFYHNRMKPDVE